MRMQLYHIPDSCHFHVAVGVEEKLLKWNQKALTVLVRILDIRRKFEQQVNGNFTVRNALGGNPLDKWDELRPCIQIILCRGDSRDKRCHGVSAGVKASSRRKIVQVCVSKHT